MSLKRMGGFLPLTLVVAIFIVAACSSAPEESASNSQRSTTVRQQMVAASPTPNPVHWNLAVIHVGRGGDGETPFNDETLLSRRFDFLLDRLASKCGDSKEKIGDMTVVGHNLLLESGMDMPLLDLMEQYNQTLNSPVVGSCSETFALVTWTLTRP